MPGRRRVRRGVFALVACGIVGTSWFWLVEGWSFLDALYQTTTTITTVGFGEVRPFDSTARAFAIGLMIFGVAAALYTFGVAFEEFIEEHVNRRGRRRMDRQINALSGHTIVCGYGRVGSKIASLLSSRGAECIVVDVDEARCSSATDDGYLTVEGDSTEDKILTSARVEHAATLIVSLASDADAISTVLSARSLNGDVRIVARANAKSSEAKLSRAGANRVVNPLLQGAQRIAAFAQQPAVADFLDVVVHDGSLEYRLEELVLPEHSPLAHTSLGEAHLRARTGALVLALRGADDVFHSNPGPETELREGVTLIVIGTTEQLSALERLATGGAGGR